LRLLAAALLAAALPQSDDAVLRREAERLIAAYPDQLVAYRDGMIVWRDGTRMVFDDGKVKTHEEKLRHPDLEDQVSECYPKGPLAAPPGPGFEPGRVRYEPFFRKMYGGSSAEVRANLVRIRWAPSGEMLEVTRVNGVAEKLRAVGDALARDKAALPYVTASLGGTFNWRRIAGEDRLSAHSFGIAMDIDTRHSDYWRWQNSEKILPWRNRIPFAVVEAFEKAGFIWGGKWQRFDTMHFEYRPEVFCGE
jgi:hypothetical protein